MTTIPKKPKAAELEKSLVEANQRITALEAAVKERDDELAAFRNKQGVADTALADVQQQLAIAIAGLKPFAEKTKEWEAWPPETACAVRRLTFGDIKRAAEVAVALMPKPPAGARK